jgi:hypothetical protein
MTRPEAEAQVDLELQQTGLTRREWYRTVYLNSDHWKSLREEALKTHGEFCFICDRDEDLQVHHLRYRSIFNVKVSDLQILCRRCHELEHSKPKKKRARKERKPRSPRKSVNWQELVKRLTGSYPLKRDELGACRKVRKENLSNLTRKSLRKLDQRIKALEFHLSGKGKTA